MAQKQDFDSQKKSCPGFLYVKYMAAKLPKKCFGAREMHAKKIVPESARIACGPESSAHAI